MVRPSQLDSVARGLLYCGAELVDFGVFLCVCRREVHRRLLSNFSRMEKSTSANRGGLVQHLEDQVTRA
ncbi:hypothetical protein XAC3810_430010 [Xanthomonas citri pv. citri]|uniref:Uncharacterized protein n=1 Tax=Xanthomonas citri pv. citri TaxID=611301 RepID=A0A0U5FE21_XANCI|nr:hypothetical protein XAC9322_430033 [Xanthomonas citri pv. citri]CEE28516.1 hypothetical protein XAC1083_430034 [Xanthomonas citri pv. citri]CEE37660.1 hypothetical protein XAC3810_430010 [Xanthomonas citri pv. citri]CEE40449.1 hypothetical protein XAC2911_400033 [Xanthomonas citri pv. citri]CEE43487.1 hypothetical protein XAC908_590033 [Xanthomonas citri pv. citri]